MGKSKGLVWVLPLTGTSVSSLLATLYFAPPYNKGSLGTSIPSPYPLACGLSYPFWLLFPSLFTLVPLFYSSSIQTLNRLLYPSPPPPKLITLYITSWLCCLRGWWEGMSFSPGWLYFLLKRGYGAHAELPNWRGIWVRVGQCLVLGSCRGRRRCLWTKDLG